jgi:8-oxo-dGTP diphosphatase
MANSNLEKKDKQYTVPQYIIKEIKKNLSKIGNTYSTVRQKAENIVTNKVLTYENLKRVKGIIDKLNEVDLDLESRQREKHRQQNKIDFMIMGGDKMKNWVESELKQLRNPIERSKKVKTNFAGFKNQFRTEHSKLFVKAPKTSKIKNMIKDLKPPTLMENDDLSVDLPIRLKFACICIVFNEENKLLLVKRSENDNWMAGKYALIGGGIEENEIPEECVIREAKEETNLTLKKPKLVYSTIEGSTFLYVFVSKVTNSDRIKLNDEHSGYVWVDSGEIQKYDTVPNLMEMIRKVHSILLANNEGL